MKKEKKSILVKKEVREKLKALKFPKTQSYDSLINELIDLIGGEKHA